MGNYIWENIYGKRKKMIWQPNHQPVNLGILDGGIGWGSYTVDGPAKSGDHQLVKFAGINILWVWVEKPSEFGDFPDVFHPQFFGHEFRNASSGNAMMSHIAHAYYPRYRWGSNMVTSP